MFTNEAVGSRLAIGYSRKETAECSANVRSNIFLRFFHRPCYRYTDARLTGTTSLCCVAFLFALTATKRFSRFEFRKKYAKVLIIYLYIYMNYLEKKMRSHLDISKRNKFSAIKTN